MGATGFDCLLIGMATFARGLGCFGLRPRSAGGTTTRVRSGALLERL